MKQVLAEFCLIIHGCEFGIMVIGLTLGGITKDARCGCHIKPLFRGYMLITMGADKVAVVFILQCDACGTMGFIANHKVEFWQAVMLLGVGQDINGMVGRKHDSHLIRVCAQHLPGDLLWIGRRWKSQIVYIQIEAVGICIATDFDI